MQRSPGAILYLTLLVVATILVLSTIALSGISTAAQLQRKRLDTSRAFYLAEAGRNRVLATLARRGTWHSSKQGTEYTLGEGSYAVSTEDLSDDVVRVTCEGYIPNRASARATETVTFDCVVYGFSGNKHYVFLYGWSRQ